MDNVFGSTGSGLTICGVIEAQRRENPVASGSESDDDDDVTINLGQDNQSEEEEEEWDEGQWPMVPRLVSEVYNNERLSRLA